MRRLLRLDSDGQTCWLPLAARSAVDLERRLLEPSHAGDAMRGCLAGDPPLVLWTIWRRWQRERRLAANLSETGQWLLTHLPELLVVTPPEEPDAEGTSQFAEQVGRDLLLAELASLLAEAEEPRLAEEAYFHGLLQEPGRWLSLAGAPSVSPPEWLSLLAARPAAVMVARAKALLAGESNEGLVPEARRRVAPRREQWMTPPAYDPIRLPEWAAKLARLDQLEQRFQEVLEQEKLAAMAEFAAGAGHEINNPLTIIAGRAQLFLRQEKDPDRRRELALINAQAMRVYEMIADMRLFARPPEPERKPCDLVELVDRALSELAPRAAEQETSLERQKTAEPIRLMVDPTQIVVAIKALCANALEALRHGGRVELEMGRQSDRVTLRVRDDGPGINAEERRHLFDPFFSARQAGRGLGMGLCKCWRIVIGHGGQIDVQSEPGHGASFTITLPCGEVSSS